MNGFYVIMSSIMDKMFGEWLQEILISRKWSQSDLSRAANISRQVVSDYINSKKLNPDERILIAIARALRIPPETVFRAAGLLPPLPLDQPPNLAEWIHLYVQADEATREELLSYAQFKTEKERLSRQVSNPLDNPLP